MARGDDIEERLINFAGQVIQVSGSLPHTQNGKHVGSQLLRGGTSPAANYAEARGAESKRNFVHKLKTTLKELNESCTWLQIITRSEMLPGSWLTDLLDENDQLCRIISASIQTARREADTYQFSLRRFRVSY
jgi:four helix bundle protein